MVNILLKVVDSLFRLSLPALQFCLLELALANHRSQLFLAGRLAATFLAAAFGFADFLAESGQFGFCLANKLG